MNRANPISFSAKARRTCEQPISFLMSAAVGRPDLVNLAAGFVDPLTLPVDSCADIAEKIFRNPHRARQALQYDTTHGVTELRRAVLKHLEELEGKSAGQMGFNAEQIIITTGSQQFLYLLADILIDPGDIVITANPSYFVFTGTLQSLGAKVLTVPMTEQGMDVPAIEPLLEKLEKENQLHRVKLIYCTSYYQNPTGLTLCAKWRPRLLEIARKYSKGHRILILEDAAYRELRYDGEALPSIKSYDTENQYTILSQTFSKPFSPGLKVGYTAMPQDLVEPVLQQKGNHDFGSSSLAMHIALEALRDGSYQRHVLHLQESYRKKRDAMVNSLEQFMPKVPGLHWITPHGGLYVWLTVPSSIDTCRASGMFQSCIKHGVIYVPGDYCFHPDQAGRVQKNHLRLSFGQVPLEKIESGIQRLAEVVLELLPAKNPKSKIQNPKSVVS